MGRSSFTSPPQVLELSSTDESELIGFTTDVVFLDEFRMVVIPSGYGNTKLAVFNTLIPRYHPGNLRRLGLPRRLFECAAKIHADHDRPLGPPNTDEPFIVDPAQAVLVMELTEGWDSTVFLVVRTQTLIEQAYSMPADSCVPWDKWGSDSVVMEVPVPGGDTRIFVHGAQVVVVQVHDVSDWAQPGRYRVQAFNFSWRRCRSLPVWDGGDGTEKRVLLKDEGCFLFELGGGGGSLDGLKSLSDGGLFHLVSSLSHSRQTVG